MQALNILVVARACGTHPTEAQIQTYEAHFAAHKVEASAFNVAAAAAVSIPVYFHVVSKDSTTSGGNVP